MEHFYKNLEGWFTFPHLYSQLVNVLPEGATFVEVGVWKGKSLAYFIVEAVNNNKNLNIYAVDTWKGSEEHKDETCIVNDTLFEEFTTNMSPVNEKTMRPRIGASSSTISSLLSVIRKPY